MQRPKIVFFGSDSIVLPTLDFLISPDSPVELAAIVSQPDRPHGRGQKCLPNDVSAWALAHNVELRRSEKLSPEDTAWLAQKNPRLCLVMAYGHLLKNDLLAVPPLGFLNLHASLLPAYRGASPILGAVADGLNETGVSLMRIVPQMDAGDVCGVEKIKIETGYTVEDLRPKLARACVPLLERMLPLVLAQKAVFTPQDSSKVSYTRKISKDDGLLDFNQPAELLARRVRALSPWPACCVEVDGARVKIYEATAIMEAHKALPGTILHAGQCGLQVATAQGILNLTQLQRPGGKRLCAADFLNGFPIQIGRILQSVPLCPLVSPTPFPRKKPTVSFDKTPMP